MGGKGRGVGVFFLPESQVGALHAALRREVD